MNSKTQNKIFLVILGFLLQTYTNAQLFVGTGASIYAKNKVVYVKQDLEIKDATSNFYLRNGSQFLQGTTGSGANKGLGNLSVFQEGSVSNYEFNYWCSPVGNSTTVTSVNNPFGVTQLGVPATTTISTPVTILARNNYDGKANPFSIAPYWIFKFQAKSSYSDWVQVGSASSLNAGEGFTMKGSSGTDTTPVDGVQNNPDGFHQRYDFRGKPNDGTIDILVLPKQMTLTGNPYPSAIDLKMFLSSESNCTGTAYFWEQDKTVKSHYAVDYKGGYGTYVPGGTSSPDGIYLPATFFSYDGSGNQLSASVTPPLPTPAYERHYSPIGQGFMIQGSSTVTGNVQMKNSYRVYVKEGAIYKSQFEKKANYKTAPIITKSSQIRFNTLLNDGPISQMVLAFDSNSTDGIDHAMDAISPNNGPANAYFSIDNREFIIDIAPFEMDKKIAIGFRNKIQANYKITVNEMLNLDQVENVYLHDKIADVYYDIKNSFCDLTLPAGSNKNQYEITFKNGTLGLKDIVSQSFIVYQDNAKKSLIINNPLFKDLALCNLYDVAGKLIFSKNQLGNNSSYSFPTSSLGDGIYIVKLATSDKMEMGTKIIVKN
jgi:hypothetical protein